MKRFLAKLLISLYQGLPEWIVRSMVFFIIGVIFGLGFAFLSFRPRLRRLWSLLSKLRPQRSTDRS